MKLTTKIAALAAVSCLVLAGCGSNGSGDSTPAGTGSSAGYKITLLPKNLGNPYFDASNDGAKEAVTSFSGTLNYTGPATEGTPDSQVQFVNTAVQTQQNAIIISLNDPTAVCGALNEAMAAGVKVVTFDSDAPSCRNLFVNQVEGEGIAQTLVDMIAEQIGDSGEVAWLSATANATNQNTWMEAANAIFAKDHPNIKIVDTVYGDDQDQASFDKTAALLASHPNLKGIIAPTTVGIAAAARYLSDSEYKGKVALTGLGTPSGMKAFVDDGTVTEFALWNPVDLGYLSAFAAKALIDGDITGAQGDTFTAGRLGNYTVGANATVLLGDPYKFNKGNIGNFGF